MAAEQFHDMMQDDTGSDYTSSLDDRKSAPTAVSSSDDNNTSGGFECNICLDSVQDPVVTFCGHLFCWPCIYKWLHQSTATDNQDQLEQQCPVCKAEISQSTLIPLYGRDQGSKPAKAKASDLNLVIPRRPAGPAYDIDPSRLRTTIFSPHSTQHFHYRTYPYQPELYHGQLGTYAGSSIFNPVASQTITSNTFSHLISMFGDVVYARMFGVCTYANSYNLEHRTSPRMRRRMMQADKSLNRICFFLFCCVSLCLFSF